MNARFGTLALCLLLVAAPLGGCSSCPTDCRPSPGKSAGDLLEGVVMVAGMIVLAPFYLVYMIVDGITPETCVPCDPCDPCYPCNPCDPCPCPPPCYDPPPPCYEPCAPIPRRYEEKPGHGHRRGGGNCGGGTSCG